MITPELQIALQTAERHFKNLGYDHVRLNHVSTSCVDGAVFNVYFDLEDDFQKDTPRELRVKSEYMHYVGMFESVQEFRERVFSYPKREEREVEFLLRKLAGQDEMIKKLKSRQLAMFMESIQESMRDMANRLKAPEILAVEEIPAEAIEELEEFYGDETPLDELGMSEEAERPTDARD